MAATSTPISAAAFATALRDLSLTSLNAKAAEIHNSLSHLRSSNAQLAPFADQAGADYDLVCAESIQENEVVMARMRERLGILKGEVQGRGYPWRWDVLEEESVVEESPLLTNGHSSTGGSNGHVVGSSPGEEAQSVVGSTNSGENAQQTTQGRSGRLTDQELASRIREQMGEDDGENGGGMHL